MDHRRENKNVLMIVNIAIPNINSAVTIPKNPAAPLPAAKFFCTITNPLASAKSAILQIANQIVTTRDKT